MNVKQDFREKWGTMDSTGSAGRPSRRPSTATTRAAASEREKQMGIGESDEWNKHI